jgi:hypothetical protein
MGAKYIASLPDAGSGRGVYIPGFQSFAEDLLNVTRGVLSTWLTIVTDEQRPAFEAAAVETAARLEPSGALARQVAADGIRVATLDADGLLRGFERAPAAPLYTAAWAHAPRTLPVERYFLFNPLGEPLRRAALERVLRTSRPAMTDLAPYTFADAPGTRQPSSVVYAPAWTAQDSNTSYGVGIAPNATSSGEGHSMCSTSFHWATVRAAAHVRSRCTVRAAALA